MVSGELRVGHDIGDTSPGVTIETEYLDVIDALPTGQHPIALVIDLKDNPSDSAFTELIDVLATYNMLDDGHISVFITGNSPSFAIEHPSYVSFSGDYTLANLTESEISQININWDNFFTWDGTGVMPEGEFNYLQTIASTTHQRGKQLRIFNGPETEESWQAQYDAGVDWIAPGGAHPPGADDITGLASWRLATL